MRILVCITLVAAFALSTGEVEAQGRGGGRGMDGGMGRMPPPEAMAMMAPVVPDSLTKIAGLDQGRARQYATLYDDFMKETQSDRDSLQALGGLMRAAREQGDRSGAQGYMGATRELRERIGKRHKALDDATKKLLTDEQWKAYEQWRDQQRKAMIESGRPPRGRRPPP